MGVRVRPEQGRDLAREEARSEPEVARAASRRRVIDHRPLDPARFEQDVAASGPSVVQVASHAVFIDDVSTSFVLGYDHMAEIVSPSRRREEPSSP